MSTALDAAQAFIEAMERGDWQVAAAAVDPVWGAEFHLKELAHLVAWCGFREMKRKDPSLSGFSSDGDVTEELLDQYSTHVIPALPGRPTIGALRALSPARFLELFLETSFGERYTPDMRHILLGSLPFDHANEYVLYYRSFPNAPPEWSREGDGPPYASILVVTLRGGTWGVRIGHEFTTSLSLSLMDDDANVE